jgi:uncharacterized protein (DUF302 family)
LGCNPAFSYRALQAEDKIGVMLPCNVLVIEQGENDIEIAAVNPADAMAAVKRDSVPGCSGSGGKAEKSFGSVVG